MPHRVLRSAATVLLATAPLVAAVSGRAAAQQNFPCAVAIQKVTNSMTSVVTLTVQCSEARTIGARITVGGTELASHQLTVQANVQQGITIVAPRVSQVCATLETEGGATTLCTP